jgi:hypothetical protein
MRRGCSTSRVVDNRTGMGGSSAVYPDLVSGWVHVLFDNLGGPMLSLIGSASCVRSA